MIRRLPPVLRLREFALYWASILVTGFGGQMVIVAVGWQVYAIHRSAFDLGLIGLMEFIPLPLLALPAGQLADRAPRRIVLAAGIVIEIAVASGLLVVTLSGARQLWPFLALAIGTGIAAAIQMPAGRALPAMLVPMELIPNAMAIRSIGFQAAIVSGPAIGGIVFSVSPKAVYLTAVALLAVGLVCVIAIRERTVAPATESVGIDTVLAGIRFIRATPVILGAITLDLFAVLFGGAVALLPLFARSILHTGPVGLGVLRSAPAVGALAAGIMIARRPLAAHVGRTLLMVVAAFGVSMVVFGISHSFALSAIALAVSGFVDMISMNIRATTVALATPDELRGRVNAVEMVFISASNELGAFESGAAAALLGAVTSVVAGGAITIGLAAIWTKVFPGLSRLDRFEDATTGSLQAHADRAYPSDSPA